jgi:hypothetical protein
MEKGNFQVVVTPDGLDMHRRLDVWSATPNDGWQMGIPSGHEELVAMVEEARCRLREGGAT